MTQSQIAPLEFPSLNSLLAWAGVGVHDFQVEFAPAKKRKPNHMHTRQILYLIKDEIYYYFGVEPRGYYLMATASKDIFAEKEEAE